MNRFTAAENAIIDYIAWGLITRRFDIRDVRKRVGQRLSMWVNLAGLPTNIKLNRVDAILTERMYAESLVRMWLIEP